MPDKDQDEIESEILDLEGSLEINEPQKLEFRPWHKPRKQFVRREQWLIHAENRIVALKEEHAVANDKPLRYLTLPGPDMLDVVQLAELCKTHSVQLHFTGFFYGSPDQSARLRQNISDVRSRVAGIITPTSRVIPHALEEITQRGSSADIALRKGGPYHIVNLDVCTPVFGAKGPQSSILGPIKTILNYQANHLTKDWALYVTTALPSDNINAKEVKELVENICDNCAKVPNFEIALGHEFGATPTADLLEQEMIKEGAQFTPISTLGISKWLLHLSEHVSLSVAQLEGLVYRLVRQEKLEDGSVETLNSDMVSLAYLIKAKSRAIPKSAGFKLPKPNLATAGPTPDDHLRMIRRAYSLVDVDAKLADDSAIEEACLKETEKLLAQMGYDVHGKESYRAWWAAQKTSLLDAM